MSDDHSIAEFRCPGESYSISRAVHLSRLADYFPACRECPRQTDVAGLSTRQVRRIEEVHARSHDRPWFGAEGMRDVAINDISAPVARRIGSEFARRVQESSRHTPCAVRSNLQAPHSGRHAERACYFLFASDGRLSTSKIVAAVVEGIRWTGCETIDLGPASAPCLAAAMESLSADGGIYLGNPGGAAHTLGVKFWLQDEPLSRGEWMESLAESINTRLDDSLLNRPVRAFGPLRRMNAADDYLNDLRPAYHALRPLRFVIRCECEPVLMYLSELLQNVACHMIPAKPGGMGRQVVAEKANFGIEITNDGENACVYDEQGQTVATERLVRTITDRAPLADALRTLTLLLVLLSRDDQPLSAVLDREAAVR